MTKRRIRKNVMFDDESLERLVKQSTEMGMNHSEYIRHLLSRMEHVGVVVPGGEINVEIAGRQFRWDGKRSYVLVGGD